MISHVRSFLYVTEQNEVNYRGRLTGWTVLGSTTLLAALSAMNSLKTENCF